MQISELAAKVQALGLTDKEAKVYVAALFLGPASAQKIAEQAEINRATTYVIIAQLEELGLISQSTESKKTVFVAEGPEMLRRIFDRQIEAVEERRRDLADLLPDLQQMQRAPTGDAPVVRFYRGSTGVLDIIQELQRKAPSHSQINGFSNLDEVRRIFPDTLKSNPERRVKKQLSSKMIYSAKRPLPSNPKELRQTVRIDQPIKADVSLVGDATFFCTYAGRDSISVVIESPEITAALRQLFDLAWTNQKP